MKAWKFVAIAFLIPSAVIAAVVTFTGATVQQIAPPAVVNLGVSYSTIPDRVTVWNEQQNLAVASVAADMVNNPGSSAAPVAGSVTGTVDVHFIHFRHTAGQHVLGSITFSGKILGVAYDKTSLDASDTISAPLGTTYASGEKRGIKVPEENVSISGKVLTFDLVGWYDGYQDTAQVRVFTEHGGCHLTDDGFDTPVPNNGTGGGWTSMNINISGGWSPNGGNPGAYFWINATGGATDPTLQQTITGLTPGFSYRVFGDHASMVREASPPNVVSFLVEVADTGAGPWTVVYSGLPTALGQWTAFQSATFSATSPTMELRMRAEVFGTDNDFGVDNICVQEVPPSCHADNGSFDTPVPNNGTGGSWTSSYLNVSGGWSATGGNPDAYFWINATGSPATDPTLQQSITGLVPGLCYQVVGDYASIAHDFSPPGAVSFLVEVADTTAGPWTTVFSAVPTTVGQWTALPSVIFSATSSTMELRFRAEVFDTDNDFGVDNICVQIARCCPSDFNWDGFIDPLDYNAFINAFETGDMSADFNGDGFLDPLDYNAYINAFESGC